MSIDKNPILSYEKDYSTYGNIPKRDDNLDKGFTDDDYNDLLKDLIDSLNNIRDAIDALPDRIKNALLVPIAGVDYMLNSIDKDKYNPDFIPTQIIEKSFKPDNISIPITPPHIGDIDDNTDIDLELPEDPFGDDSGIAVTYEVVKAPERDIIVQQYAYDMVTIFKNYINKLEESLESYYTQMFTIQKETDLDFLSLYAAYDTNTNKISDPNKHISDFIIRSQVQVDQELRLYKKMFDVDSMSNLIRSCKSSSQFRERYANSEYIQEESIMAIEQNNMLQTIKQDTEKKYKENLYNLYKYLNSSVIIINESLKKQVGLSEGKAILIKKEGVSLLW